jgi:hypothetical protein
MSDIKEVLNLQTYKTLNRNNKYFQFIESCLNKQYGENIKKHMHHIIPQYVFRNGSPEDLDFMNSPENAIELSLEDHIQAHVLLFEVYGNLQDKGAAYLLDNYEQESRAIWQILGAKASHKVQQAHGKNMWNNEFQKEMAKRSLAKPDALETRSKGGKIGGKKRNEGIAIKPHERYIFFYKKEPILCVLNCSTGGDVVAEIKKFESITGQTTKLSRATNLLSGERNSLYDWSCMKLDSIQPN